MTGSQAVKMPTRKDLLVFGLLLPLFCALLGWLAVGGRRGLVVAAAISGCRRGELVHRASADGKEAPGVCDSTSSDRGPSQLAGWASPLR